MCNITKLVAHSPVGIDQPTGGAGLTVTVSLLRDLALLSKSHTYLKDLV